MNKAILTTTAHLDNPGEMAGFLAPIPHGVELGKVLAKKQALSTRAYDDDAETARFVASDGVTVKCFAVQDVTIDQAEMIAAVCEEMHAWDESEFREAASEALGTAFDHD